MTELGLAERRSGSGPSSAAIDEASAWLALLHGPRRSSRLERGFQRWLAVRPEHRAAFEVVTSTWEASGKLQLWPEAGRKPVERRTMFVMAAATCASIVALLVVGAIFFLNDSGVVTAPGEQRALTLDDGSRVFLNTDTRLLVRYDDRQRAIDLRRGEALFEVAKDASRPFVVSAGDREIRAVGTAFVVRRDMEQVVVTLVEGKVAVTEKSSSTAAAASSSAEAADTHTLGAGERLTLRANSAPRLDRPTIETVTAWRRGRIEFDDVALADAVAEMNRYSRIELRLAHPEAASILVKGAFRVGDSASFAAAMEHTCHLQITTTPDEIVLDGVPSANCR